MSSDGTTDGTTDPGPRVPWLRTALGAAAVAALAWTATLPGGWGADGTASTDAATRSGPVVDDAEAVLVEQAALGCAGHDVLSGQVRAVTAPEQLVAPGGAGTGGLDLLGPQGPPADPVPFVHGGEPASARLETEASASVTATGGAAPGLVAGQVLVGPGPGARSDGDEGAGEADEDTDGEQADGGEDDAGSVAGGSAPRGIGLSGCVQPGEEHWVLAGGPAAGRTESLVLTNPGADPVRVDLELRGEDGPVRVTGGSGLVVAPGDRLVRPLDALAGGVEAPALRVSAEGGPVAAQLVETYRDGTTELGVAVTSPAATPARDLVVPAVPAGEPTDLVLRVLAPEAPAVVELGVLTEAGRVTPRTAAVRVAAGSTTDVPLDELADGAAGLRLRSDVPVTAALQVRATPADDAPAEDATATARPGADDAVSTTRAPGDRPQVIRPAGDLAWLPATSLSTQPVGMAVPDLADVPGARLQLSLVGLDATTAEVLLRTGEGGTTSRTVELGNDSSALVEVPEGTTALWVRPARPAMPGVAAALHLTGQDDLGPYLAATTLRPVPWTREVSQVSSVLP
ncbi:DUF5719 family protein [Serinicoccus sediminis]|uniref:DUF5719 family protein n=1 Tax=Serinicoccus sediminis TaxID=2306021 RepID=UPI0010225547|nr:DUF5719 family protein [Serinicoccus sediminis]